MVTPRTKCAPPADGDDVQPAVGIATCLADERGRADIGQATVHRTDLATLADEHHAERLAARDAAIDHQPVALLEDVQRQRHAGAEDRVEGKEREFHRRCVCPPYGIKQASPGARLRLVE